MKLDPKSVIRITKDEHYMISINNTDINGIINKFSIIGAFAE